MIFGKKLLAVAALASLLAPVLAQPVVLDFEGIAAPGSSAAVGSFYSGLGVSFSSNAIALNGYNGSNEPTPTTILYFASGASTLMNYASGFDTGLAFFYSSGRAGGKVSIFDGLNGSGSLLASFDLAQQHNQGCPPGSTGSYCNWTDTGVAFNGLAHSVVFAGAANSVGFDNVTFGSSSAVAPVPEATTFALMGLGLLGVGFMTRRRQAAT